MKLNLTLLLVAPFTLLSSVTPGPGCVFWEDGCEYRFMVLHEGGDHM